MQQLANQIEDTLELPLGEIPVPQPPSLDSYSPANQARIRDMQEHLKKAEKTNGYGMELAVTTLKVVAETGYPLTDEESDKLKMLLGKSTYGVENALHYFPKKNQYSRQDDYTTEDLSRYIVAWAKEQTDHRPLLKLAKEIEKSERFIAPASVAEAITNRLSEIKTELQASDVRKAYLAKLGAGFRPRFEMEKDIRTVVERLFPVADLFTQDTEAIISQAMDLAAKRSTEIDFAGRTADGKLYIITSSTDSSNYELGIFYGEPGQLQKLTLDGGIRARDGSHDTTTTKEGVTFEFKRGGLFDGHDLSKWQGFVNDVRVAEEFPTPELRPKRN